MTWASIFLRVSHSTCNPKAVKADSAKSDIINCMEFPSNRQQKKKYFPVSDVGSIITKRPMLMIRTVLKSKVHTSTSNYYIVLSSNAYIYWINTFKTGKHCQHGVNNSARILFALICSMFIHTNVENIFIIFFYTTIWMYFFYPVIHRMRMRHCLPK